MTAKEYVKLVVESQDPYQHSVSDQEFKALTKLDQDEVIYMFDGYGLRDLVQKYRSKK